VIEPSKKSPLARRRVAAAAAVFLAVVLLARNSPRELAERMRYLVAYAPRELAVRRLGGSSAAFDRRFFLFLESARRSLPKRTRGVIILPPAAGEPALYLAAYVFAPVPVAFAPARVPPNWIVAVYGSQRPGGWSVVAEVRGGALMAPVAPAH
jgi:hypothetical protein